MEIARDTDGDNALYDSILQLIIHVYYLKHYVLFINVCHLCTSTFVYMYTVDYTCVQSDTMIIHL